MMRNKKRFDYEADKVLLKKLSDENDFLEFVVRLGKLYRAFDGSKLIHAVDVNVRGLISSCFCNLEVECKGRAEGLNND